MSDDYEGGGGGEAVDATKLRSIIERYERLETRKKEIAEDQKEVLAEAKSDGYDVKTIRQIIKLRAMEDHVRREEQDMLDLYKAALGME